MHCARSCLFDYDCILVKKMFPGYSTWQHKFARRKLFKGNMLDRYIDRPNPKFLKGKFAICFASFSANYDLRINIKASQDNVWQPLVLGESLKETKNQNERFLPNEDLIEDLKEET